MLTYTTTALLSQLLTHIILLNKKKSLENYFRLVLKIELFILFLRLTIRKQAFCILLSIKCHIFTADKSDTLFNHKVIHPITKP